MELQQDTEAGHDGTAQGKAGEGLDQGVSDLFRSTLGVFFVADKKIKVMA